MVMAPWEKAQMTLPTAMTTADNITAEITSENALFLDALFLLNFVSPFKRYKKGLEIN